MGHELLAATEDVQLLDTTKGPLTVTLLMLTAELLPLERVKVNHAVPVPTGVLPKLLLAGLRVRVWAMSANGANNEAAIRVRIRLQTGLIGMLLNVSFAPRVQWRKFGGSSVEVRRMPASAIRPRFWVSEGKVSPGGGRAGQLGGGFYSYIALMNFIPHSYPLFALFDHQSSPSAL
jgi:hypothetical protein